MRQQTHHTKRTSAEKGQSLVELAFMMVVLILLLTGILDLGRAYFTLIALRDAAGEGAYYGSIHPICQTSTSGATCGDPNNITYRTQNSAPVGGLIDWTSTTVAVTAPSPPTPGHQVTVTITYNYTILTPFIGTIAGGQTLPLSASATAEILSAGP